MTTRQDQTKSEDLRNKSIKNKNKRFGERGNVFFTLFGAVAIVGVLGAGIMSTMRGPLSTMVDVNRIEQAKAEMRVSLGVLLTDATDQDTDSLTEPLDPESTCGTGVASASRGCIPATSGAPKTDPWGKQYAYCAWNNGTDSAALGSRILGGGGLATNIAVALISAGPDGNFDNDCGADPTYVPSQSSASGDDIVISMTYTEAVSGSGGLWTAATDGASDPSAEIDRHVDLTGSVTGSSLASAQLRLGAASMLLPLKSADFGGATACAGNDNLLRINDDASPIVEICDGTNWVSASSIWTLSGSDLYYTGGNVGIGMTNPNDALDVVGTVQITGATVLGNSLSVAGNYTSAAGNMDLVGGTLDVGGATTLDSTLDVAGDFDIGAGDFTVDSTNGNTQVGGTLGVTSDSDLDGNIDVAGNYTSTAGNMDLVGGTLDVGGATTLDSTLDVAGDFDIRSGNFTVAALSGNTQVGGTLNVDGMTTVNDLEWDDGGTTKDLTPATTCSGTQYIYWDGNSWECREDVGAGGSGGTINLGDLNDVNESSPSDNQCLIRSGSNWVNGSCSGATALDDLTDVVATTPTTNNCLVYNGTNWVDGSCASSGGVWENTGSLIRVQNAAGDWAVDDFVFGSDRLGEYATDATRDARFWFDKSKGAFRAGLATGTQWDDANVGDGSIGLGDGPRASGVNSVAIGDNSQASGLRAIAIGTSPQATNSESIAIGSNITSSGVYSLALGRSSVASGTSSTAMGHSAVASGDYSTAMGGATTASGLLSTAMGMEAKATGDYTMAIGLADQTNTDADRPQISGEGSFGIFMDQYDSYNLSDTDMLAIIGGQLMMDDDGTSAATRGCIRFDDTAGKLQYADDCTTYTSFDDIAVTGGLWTENTTHITRENVHILDAGQTVDSAGLNGGTNGLIWDTDNNALRAGQAIGTQWDDANIGANSLAFGYNTTASGDYSTAMGNTTTATNESSFAAGFAAQALGQRSIAMGHSPIASGQRSVALGQSPQATGAASVAIGTEVQATGVESMAFGGKYNTATDPIVSGDNSVGFFLGDQSGVDVTAANTFSLMGGTMAIGDVAASTGGTQDLELDVTGDVGATNYCDADGNNCFTAASVGAVVGNDTEIIFNDGGSAYGSDADFTYDNTTDTVTMSNVVVNGTITGATNTSGEILVNDGSSYTNVGVSGDASLAADGTLTIAADAVEESMLKAVDAAVDEECLTYELTTGDFEWQDCNSGGVSAIDDLSDAANDGADNNLFLGHDGGSAGDNNDFNTAVGATALFSLNNDATVNAGDFNTAMGYRALYSNTTGAGNHAFGYGTLHDNTVGDSNVALGQSALYTNVAGTGGVAIGNNSQRYVNDTAVAWTNGNTSIGHQALRGSSTASANTGNWNTAIGYNSLRNYTSGNYNTALGTYALNSMTTGSSNVALGYYAGRYIADGSTGNATSGNSIYIGADAKALADGDTNEIVIGYNATGLGSNTAVLGNDSITLTALKGNVAIGSTAVSTGGEQDLELDVTGDVGATNYCDADGNNCFTAATVGSVDSIDDLSDAATDYATDFNMFMGDSAGASIAAGGQYNIGIGQNALTAATTGDNNVSIGHNAGAALTTGYSNVFLGVGAYDTAITAFDTIAIGPGALGNADSGADYNIAIGSGALQNGGADSNMAIGVAALQSNGNLSGGNTAIGHWAMQHIDGGTDNTALGRGAGSGTNGVSTGVVQSVFLGRSAGSVIETGDNNTFVGYQAGDSVTTGSSNILIGHDVDASAATASNELNIGDLIKGTIGSGLASIEGTGAFTVPIGTTAQRPTAVNGMMRYNSTTAKFEMYQAGAWTNLAGASVINDLTDAYTDYATYNNFFLGHDGGGSLGANTFSNTGVGINALDALDNSSNGFDNTALGKDSLTNLATGLRNTAIGSNALKASTGGSHNTSVGYNSSANTQGVENTALGLLALNIADGGDSNIAIGAYAIGDFSPTTGNIARNTVIGTRAGSSFAGTNYNNILLGYQAGDIITTGDDNIIIGYDIDPSSATASNELNIGDLIKGTIGSGLASIEGTGAFTPPVGTVAQRPGTPIEGMIRYNSDSDVFEGYVDDGTPAWEPINTGAGGLWTDNTTHITRSSVHILNTGETVDSAGLDGGIDGVIWDTDNNALRAGGVASTYWDDANIGQYSTALGYNTRATGTGSFAAGYGVGATSNYAVALGFGASASGTYSFAAGDFASAQGTSSVALGDEVVASGTNAMAIGLGDTAGTHPVVSGASSLGIFMGDQDGADVTAANTFSLMGGTMAIGDVAASTGGTQDLELDVTGDIGAVNYCDENGDNCFTAATVGSVDSIDDLSDGITDYATDFNMFMGDSAGASIAAGGQYNLGIGQNALTAATTGDANIAMGYNALDSVVTGSNSIAIGHNAAPNFVGTDFRGVVAIGTNAFAAMTTGDYNTGIGRNVGRSVTGGRNTLIGDAAGEFITGSSSRNTVVGSIAFYGASTGGSNNVVLGANAMEQPDTDVNRNVVLGSDAGFELAGDDNIAIGYQAGYGVDGSTTAANQNVFIGRASGYAIETGDNNIGIGYEALNDVTSGTGNVALGHGAGDRISSSYSNTAIGGNALAGNNVSHRNTAVGSNALESTTDTENTGVGAAAGQYLRTGSDNVFLGQNTGRGETTSYNYDGANNVIIGADTAMDLDATNDQNTIIGSDAAATLTGGGSGNILLGYGVDVPTTTTSNYLNIGNLIYGDLANSEVFLDAPAAAPADGDLANGQVTFWLDDTNDEIELKGKDASGDIVTVSLGAGGTGATDIDGLSDAWTDYATTYHMFMGQGSGSGINTTGSRNLGIGRNTLTGDDTGCGGFFTCGNNVAVGDESLRDNTTGDRNVALGTAIMRSNTTGDMNVGIGHATLDSNTTGSRNIGIGASAIQFATTGNDNIGLGERALYNTSLGDSNVAIGRYAGYSSTAGDMDNNTIIGHRAGSGFAAGATEGTGPNNNILLGYQAGDVITTGDDNIIIGYDIDPSSATASNELNIGGLIYGDLANSEVFLDAPAAAPADGDLANGQVTFWVDATNDEIELKAKDSAGDVINVTVGGGGGGLWTSGSGDDIYYNTGTPQVGIGTTTPISTFDVSDASGWPSLIMSSGNITLPSYTGSSSLGGISTTSAFGRIRANRGAYSGVTNGGLSVEGFTEAAANNGTPLQLIGTHGGNSPTTAAIKIAAQKYNGGNSRSAIASTEPLLDIENLYDIGSLVFRMLGDGSMGLGDFDTDTIESTLHLQSGDIRLDGGAGNEAGCLRFDDTADKLQFSNDCTTFTNIDGAGGGALNDLSDGYTDYATDHNIVVGNGAGASIATGAQNNTIFGEDAFAGTTTNAADFNTAFGVNTLNAVTSGDRNTAFGANAARSITTPTGNTAFGQSALRLNVTGDRNTAIGNVSLYNSTGDQNVALGSSAGIYLTTGNYNVLLGTLAGRGETTNNNYDGSRNVIIGQEAAADLDGTNDNNTIIGSQTAASLTGGGSNNILLGYGVDVSSATASNELNIGDLIKGTIGSGLASIEGTGALTVPIGTTAQRPTAVNGMMRYNSTTAKFEMYQAGAWTNLAGASEINDLTDGITDYATDFNMFMGDGAGASNAVGGQYNLALGQNALNANTVSDLNLAIGYGALDVYNSATNSAMLAIGYNALGAATDGRRSIAVGADALKFLTSSFDNTALGMAAGEHLSSGGTNTILGALAGSQNTDGGQNVFVGWAAGAGASFGQTGVNNNVAVGILAGAGFLTGAQNNTIIGESAGRDVDGGSYNIMIGSGAEPSVAGASNELNIGDLIKGTIGSGLASIEGTGALTVPVGTTAERPTAVNGMIRYNSTTAKFEMYQAGAWTNLAGASVINDLTDAATDYAIDFNMAMGDGAGTSFIVGGQYNLAIGQNALNSATISDNNIAFGHGALDAYNSLTDGGMLAIGRDALGAATDGRRSIAIGNNALSSWDDAPGTSDNTAVGASAGLHIQNGGGNAFFGQGAGEQHTEAADNVFIGANAGSGGAFGQTNIYNNTAVGTWAGSGFLTGATNNVILGFDSGSDIEGGSSNILIGYNVETSATGASNELNIGDLIKGTIGSGLASIEGTGALTVPIGTTAERPTAVNGMMRYNSTTAKFEMYQAGAWTNLAGASIINDLADAIHDTDDYSSLFLGNGAGISDDGTDNKNVGVGKNALSANTTGESNIAIGWNSLPANTTGKQNIAAGAYSLYVNTTGDYNVAIGNAVLAANTSGDHNTGSGWAVLNANTTGTYNTATGSTALNKNTTGTYNTATGSGALALNTTGFQNTATGAFALYSNEAKRGSTAIGYQAMRYADDTTTGSTTNNTALGYQALMGSTTAANNTGTGNTALGAQALQSNTSGSDNTMLGYGAGYNGGTGANTTGSGNIFIGKNVIGPTATTSNYLNIGDTIYGDLSNDYVGIGTVSPDQALDVTGNIELSGNIMGTGQLDILSGSGNNDLNLNAGTAGGDVNIYVGADSGGNSNCLALYNDGTVDIEYDCANKELTVPNGSIGIGTNAPNVELHVVGDIEYTGTITDISDARLKDNIAPLSASTGDLLERIAQIDTFSFTMKGDESARTEFGVMAQDLEKIFPELVHTAKDEMGTKSVNYMGLIAPMIEATKELKAENDALKTELADIKTAQAQTNDILAELGDQVELLNKVAMNSGTSKASMDGLLMLLLGLLGGGGLVFFAFSRRRV